MAGPRVLHVIGEDYPFFRRLSHTNRDGIPAVAILTQAGLTLAFIFTASFETILVFAGFTLGLNSLLTVAGVFVLRVREPEAERPYRVWGYPFTPLVYLGLTGQPDRAPLHRPSTMRRSSTVSTSISSLRTTTATSPSTASTRSRSDAVTRPTRSPSNE